MILAGTGSERTFVRSDGIGGVDLVSPDNTNVTNQLRYHARTGQSHSTPLLFIRPREKAEHILTISLKGGQKMEECSWCCRLFPVGMKCCSKCEQAGNEVTYYCDQRCQQAAYVIHKKKHDVQVEGE